MIILGIESTAHTFGIGVVRDKKILANVTSVYKPKKGGIVPREAMAQHCENAKNVLDTALKKANVSIDQVDLIAVATGPGMSPCLRVGTVMARSLALKYSKSLVSVNHAIAHVEIGKMTTGAKDPVVLYVSGGNTQVLAKTERRYRVFGEAIDTPIGGALDKFARELGIPHPGGPEIEKLAKKGKWIDLPYVVKGMDMSFSGILTAAIQKYNSSTASREDLCFSIQETCFSMLTEVCERALAHTGKQELMLVGGVAANKRLTEMLEMMCKERGAKFFVVPMEYSGDNGAMIAMTGFLEYNSGKRFKLEDTRINRYWRIDDIDV